MYADSHIAHYSTYSQPNQPAPEPAASISPPASCLPPLATNAIAMEQERGTPCSPASTSVRLHQQTPSADSALIGPPGYVAARASGYEWCERPAALAAVPEYVA